MNKNKTSLVLEIAAFKTDHLHTVSAVNWQTRWKSRLRVNPDLRNLQDSYATAERVRGPCDKNRKVGRSFWSDLKVRKPVYDVSDNGKRQAETARCQRDIYFRPLFLLATSHLLLKTTTLQIYLNIALTALIINHSCVSSSGTEDVNAGWASERFLKRTHALTYTSICIVTSTFLGYFTSVSMRLSHRGWME